MTGCLARIPALRVRICLQMLSVYLVLWNTAFFSWELLENTAAFLDDAGHNLECILMTCKALLLIDQNIYSFLIEGLSFCVYLCCIL